MRAKETMQAAEETQEFRPKEAEILASHGFTQKNQEIQLKLLTKGPRIYIVHIVRLHLRRARVKTALFRAGDPAFSTLRASSQQRRCMYCCSRRQAVV